MEGKTANHVFVAINAVQSDISKTGVSKGKKNQQQGFQYRGIDDILNAIAPLLSAHKLCIIPQVIKREIVERTTKTGTALYYVTVEVEYQLISAIDGSIAVAKTFGEAMDSADKATNKAMSAAFKYLAVQTFCIPIEGQDGDADSPPNTQGCAAAGIVNGKPQSAPPWSGFDPVPAASAPATTEATANPVPAASTPAVPEATANPVPEPAVKPASKTQLDAIVRLAKKAGQEVNIEGISFEKAAAEIKRLQVFKKEAA